MKSFLKINQERIILLVIIALGAFLRFYNLNWDDGHYLHPDERLYVNSSNISFPKTISEFFSPDSSLNPKMFYYGSFPLFLYRAVYAFFSPDTNFLVLSRAVSALVSILTIPIIYFIGMELFSKKVGLLGAFIFAFSVGSIQHAHFNTTESLLVFLLSLITYYSIRLARDRKYFLVIPLAISIGVAYGTKIIGLTFVLIPAIAFLYLILKEKKPLKIIVSLIAFILLSIFVGFLAAPYQLIDYEQFSKEQSYMQNVILGKDKPVFTIIYENTMPYLYQLTQVLPFLIGFITLPLALIGAFFILKKILDRKKGYYLHLFIFAYPLFYFLWSGMWYAKFSRYYMLLLPFFVLWAAFSLMKFRKIIMIAILAIIVTNGVMYLKVYSKPHTRIAGSQWIYDNIQAGKIILGEHWDDNLPLPLRSSQVFPQYNLRQLAVYDPDTPEKIEILTQQLAQGDYFIITSRRVYYSILRNKNKYPYTTRFYELLFSGQLGYRMVKSFTNYPFFFSDDIADESFQSYDHPPVHVFINKEKLPQRTLVSLILK